MEEVNGEEDSDEEDYLELSDYQCHLCRIQCKSQDDNFEHVRKEHVEYYEGILEMTARTNNQLTDA